MALLVTFAAPSFETVPPALCPALFGDAESRRLNTERRAEALDQVNAELSAILVVHRTTWSEPVATKYRGLDLVALVERHGAHVAIVRLAPDLEAIACPAGLYELEVDDSIGGARILSVLGNAVLIERDGALGYLALENAPEPRWRMVWRPAWSLPSPRNVPPPPAPPKGRGR